MSDTYYDYTGNFITDNQNDDPMRDFREPPKKKKGGFLKKLLGLVGSGIVFGFVAGLVFSLVISATGAAKQEKIPETLPEQLEATDKESDTVSEATKKVPDAPGNPMGTAAGYTVAQIAELCKPSVVSITCMSVQEVQTWFGTQQYEAEGAGSGIIINQTDTELLIATNNHVIAGAKSVSVCFNDDSEQIYSGVIKGTDPQNDLAVVSIDLKSLSDTTKGIIKVATVGDSDGLTVGEQVVAIGNALGYGQSVTSGIVSALNREVTIENLTSTLIQTDAAINPGNSGGALFNMKGELIGINSAKYADEDVEGMGYAIPISKASSIIGDLSSRKTRTEVDEKKRGYLSVKCLDVSQSASDMYGIPVGVYVKEVGEGGAAQKAGIQEGDVIVKFDGITLSEQDTLINNLVYYEAGEEVEVVIMRSVGGNEYEEITLTVTLSGQTLSDDDENSAVENTPRMPGPGSSQPDNRSRADDDAEDDLEDQEEYDLNQGFGRFFEFFGN